MLNCADMEANSTGTQDYSWILTDNQWVRAVFIVTHCWTISCIATFAKMIHDRAETAHPVFAVIYQEVLAMLAFELSGLMMMVLMCVYPDENLIRLVYSAPAFASLQFHQVSWLIVTYLRYYLLVKTKPSDFVDVQGMTKKSCLLVWAITIPFLITSHLIAYAVVAAGNWPKEVSVPNVKDLDRWVLTCAMLTSTFFYNIPDFVSIAFYLKMLRHFRQKKVEIQPVPGDQFEDMDIGSWMGDLELVTPNRREPAMESVHFQPVEAKLIMSKLGLHIIMTILDLVASLINAFLAQTILGSILTKMYMVIFCFWLPLVVVKANVKELDDMTTYITTILKCKHRRNDH